MYDDDGNELWDYRSRIYDRKIISSFIKEAEELLGSLLYERKRHNKGGFSQSTKPGTLRTHLEMVVFEGLTEDEANTLDHLERCIYDKSQLPPEE